MTQSPRDSLRTRRRRPRAGATIHDVAARAGVSVATVSRVLNGKELVRETTSRLVVDAVKSLRYVPNVAARSLSIRRSHTIGIVLPDVHGQFFSEVIRGFDLAARAAGYHILVSGSHSDAGEMLEVMEAMRGRVDAMAVMAPDVRLSTLAERLSTFGDPLSSSVPIVVLNSNGDGHDAVTVDNYGGARAMTQHLLGLGHSRIAFIRGPAQNGDARERLRGYRQVMRANGGARPELEYAGDFTEQSGHAAGSRIADLTPRPTAIFAANDSMAVGALSALAAAGIAVPQEVSVAGFDDIPIARYVTPGLTTVGVDITDLGRRAFALLLHSIANPGRAPRSERIATTLVVRDSCGARNRQQQTSKQPTRKLRGQKRGDRT
jgi:LacI family transcriptional regulator